MSDSHHLMDKVAAEAANQTIDLSDQHYVLTNCDIYVFIAKKRCASNFGLMTGEQDKARCFLAGHVAPTLRFLRSKI